MQKLHGQPAVVAAARPEKAEKPRKEPVGEQAAEAKSSRKPAAAEIAAKPAPESGNAGKAAGLGSFFKKILPGSGQTPKK